MAERPQIVESFPLTLGHVIHDYTRIPPDACEVFFHYTTRAGLTGILRDGGLRATCRTRMNDAGEFRYAKERVYEALGQIGRCPDLPRVAQSLVTYTRKNLDQFLEETPEASRAFCACLTVSADHPRQWETYAESGKGFAIGFDLHRYLMEQVPSVALESPFVYCAPVTYDRSKQYELVWRLVEAGINDLQEFGRVCSQRCQDLTALRDRVTQEIVVSLLALVDFLKDPAYSSEREMRLFLDPNNGTRKASEIRHYQRGNEIIPFVFLDFRSKLTNRLPLAEIKVGPSASFADEEAFLHGLLHDLGYSTDQSDWPLISRSSLGPPEAHQARNS